MLWAASCQEAAVSRCSKIAWAKPDLLDHLVGAGDERRRHVETDPSWLVLQVSVDELELHGPQDR